MNNRFKNGYLYKLFILFFICFFSVIYLKSYRKEIPIKTPEDLGEMVKQKNDWLKALKKTDTTEFYNLLKESYGDNYNKHAVGHIFGEILFEKSGYSAIGICDSAFFWGCHHGFVSKALSQGGEDSIQKLVLGCKSIESGYYQCIHGIGHGLIGLYGPQGLEKSLKICDEIDGDESCFTGIFMEYNFPTESKNGIYVQNVREYKNDLYSPCQTFSGKHKDSCYYELPRWWEMVFHRDFQKMGNDCQKISNFDSRKACFRGVGEMASLVSDHDVTKTHEYCKEMPTNYGHNICLTSAALGFSSVPEKKDLTREVCLFVDKQYQTECPKN